MSDHQPFRRRLGAVAATLLQPEPARQKCAYLACCGIFVASSALARFRRRRYNPWPYAMMRFFRWVNFRRECVIAVANPAAPGKQILLALDLRRNMHVRYFFARTIIDADAIRRFSEALEQAAVFIDAGSNSGAFALALAQAHPEKQVIAIEPVPANADTIARNVELNQLGNVQLLRRAVSDTPGTLSFFVNPLHDGGGSLVRPVAYRTMGLAFDIAGPAPAIEVDSVALDELIQGVTVVKIDVEGHELAALRSMETSLGRGLVPFLVVEVLAVNWPAIAAFCARNRLGTCHLENGQSADGRTVITDVAADFIVTPLSLRSPAPRPLMIPQ